MPATKVVGIFVLVCRKCWGGDARGVCWGGDTRWTIFILFRCLSGFYIRAATNLSRDVLRAEAFASASSGSRDGGRD